MKRASSTLVPFVLFTVTVLLAGAELLLVSGPASAQIIVTGPPTATAHELTAWFNHHIPAKFQGHGCFEVDPLNDAEMDAYLREGDTDGDCQNLQTNNSEDDDGDIDGVFVDNPPQITLRVPADGKLDFETFAHEYGHYVWFDLLNKDDRKQYEAIYKKQKSAHKLITDYAATNVEEGFAEAFAAYVNDPAALQHQDALSSHFLCRWPGSLP